MILDGENHGIWRTDESTSINRLYDQAKWYLGSEGVTMVNNGRAIIAIPAIELYTPTSC